MASYTLFVVIAVAKAVVDMVRMGVRVVVAKAITVAVGSVNPAHAVGPARESERDRVTRKLHAG